MAYPFQLSQVSSMARRIWRRISAPHDHTETQPHRRWHRSKDPLGDSLHLAMNPGASRLASRKVLFESLEPRLLLSADSLLSYTAPEEAADLLLRVVQEDSVAMLELLDRSVDSPAVILRERLSDEGAGEIRITGSSLDDKLTIEQSVIDRESLVVSFDGGAGTDQLAGPDAGADWELTAQGAGTLGNLSFEFVEGLLGGSGEDHLFGPSADTLWSIMDADAGQVVGVEFSGMENLMGAADNRDTFVVSADASLSGSLDGGAGGFDSLELVGGSYQTVTYLAADEHSGLIDRDGEILTYAGLEPITDTSTVADRVLSTAGEVPAALPDVGLLGADVDDRATLTDNNDGTLTFAPVSPFFTFESVTFNAPTNSLTINLSGDLGVPFLSKDVLTINSFDVAGVDLIVNGEAGDDEVAIVGTVTADDVSINAEKITLSSNLNATNVSLTATAEDDGAVDTDGDLLGGIFQGLYVALPEARIDLTGASIDATGNITLSATATSNVSATPSTLASSLDASLLNLLPKAHVTLDGTDLRAASLDVDANVNLTTSFEDAADGDDDSSTSDAAVTVVVVESDATSEVLGASNLSVSGAVALNATTRLDLNSSADGSGGTAGGTLAVTEVGADTSAYVTGSSSIAAGGDLMVGAALTSTVSTTAISTANGAADGGGTNASEQRLLDPNDDGDTSDQAQTSEGSASDGGLSFAGAVAVSIYLPQTLAYIDTTGTLSATGDIELSATATETLTSIADASNTGSGGSGVGVAVAFGLMDTTVRAYLGGSATLTAANLAVNATLDADNTYKTEAKSGVGDGSKTGVAGALAINVVQSTVEALIASASTLDLNGANLTLAAMSQTTTETNAIPHEQASTSESLGIGASIALTITDNQTRAAIEDSASVVNGADIRLDATSKHATATTAIGGAQATGNSARVLTPVVAITLAFDDTSAVVATGDMLMLSGDLGMHASHDSGILTKAEGDAEGGSSTLGASLALTIDEQTSAARLMRDLTTTGGALGLKASGLFRSRSSASASAAGAAQEDTGSSADDDQVDQQSQGQTDFANSQAGARTGSAADNTSAPSASGSGGGSMSVAAGISINIADNDLTAQVADAVTVTADGAVSISTLGNQDSWAQADGTASNGSSATIGAAVGINVSDLDAVATTGASTISADGLTVSSTMADRAMSLSSASQQTLVIADDSILVGDPQDLSSGEAVVYKNGGGSDIGGLTNNATYYVIKGDDGRIKLASSEANANANNAIDLTSQGSGDTHVLERTDHDDISFDPDAEHFSLSSEQTDTLRTGDRVIYSNGGGTDFDGLTDGDTYFAIVDDGKLQLADSREHAMTGEALEIGSAGSGTNHSITDAEHRGAADATSGASGGNLGIAGALGINVMEVRSSALIATDSIVTSRDGSDEDADTGAMQITAVSTTFAGVDAGAQQDGDTGEGTGIGASFALNLTEHQTLAAIQHNATLAGTPAANDLSLAASGTNQLWTEAEGGAEGGTAAVPVAAISIARNDIEASLESGSAILISGDLAATASMDNNSRSLAKGDAEGGNAALGVAFGLTIAEDTASVRLARDLTSTGGGLSLLAQGSAASRTDAAASAAGAGEEDANSSADDDGVNQISQSELDNANTQAANRSNSGAGSESTTAPDSSTADGSIAVAAAIAINLGTTETSASIGDGLAIVTDGALSIASAANGDSAANADGSASNGTSATVGAAVALNVSSLTNRATLGASNVTSDGASISATLFDKQDEETDRHSFLVSSTSGASGGNLGVAGSFALNLGKALTDASMSDGATVNLIDGGDGDSDAGDVSLTATSATDHQVKAEAQQEQGDSDADGQSGEAIGVGASVAVNLGDNDSTAKIHAGAVVNGANDISLSASGAHSVVTTAEGGAAGGTAVTPLVAMTVAQNDTSAEIMAGSALTIGGDLSIDASHDNEAASLAKGATEASSAAIGASLALTIAEDTLSADLARDLSAGGAVMLAATSMAASRSDAQASAAGAAQDDEDSTDDDTGVQDQSNAQVDYANSRTDGGTNSSSAPDSATSSGPVSVAAAIAINIAQDSASRATLGGEAGTPISVAAQGGLSVRSAANHDAAANADGSAVTSDDGISIGAAVAVNASDSQNHALIEYAEVSGDGVIVEATMIESAIDVEATELQTVDTDADTLFVGEQDELVSGAEVIYSNGGGTDIDGLTNGTRYFVIQGENGLIQLAASASDAEAGKAIDLEDQGAGDAHVLERSDHDNIDFDPDKSRFEVALENSKGLITGDIVRYSNGGGDDIGGLSDGSTYFAIDDGDGKLKLAEDRDKALQGEAIELTSAGTGDAHSLSGNSHATGASAKSGAGGGKTGVAGSVAINVAEGDTSARLGEGAIISARDGSADIDNDIGASKVGASANTYTLTQAQPNATTTGTSLGLGLSFGIGIAAHESIASIDAGATLDAAGDISVQADSDHAMATRAQAGAQSDGGTAIGGALALSVANNNTGASVAAGSALQSSGNVSITAASSQDQSSEADADTKGGQTGVGIAFAMGWVEDDTSALLARDVSTGAASASDVKVEATSKVNAKTVAIGSAEGSKSESDGGNTADQETQNQTDYTNSRAGTSVQSPNPGSQVAAGNSVAADQSANPGEQGGTGQQASTETQGGTVRAAAAVAATVIRPQVTANIADGLSVNADGDMSVRAFSDVDSQTQAIGLALADDAKTSVGAAVSINVADLITTAEIGEGAEINTGSATIEAGSSTGESNRFSATSLAGSGSTQKGENENTAIAGAASINVILANTTASIADDATLNATLGDVAVRARQDIALNAIAGGGALTLSDSGTSVGAAIGVNVVDSNTLASIGAGADIDALGALSVVADAEINPLELEVPIVDYTVEQILVTNLIIGAAIGSGGDAGAGSAAMNLFTPVTRASIGSGAMIDAGADVSVLGIDDTKVTDFTGSLAVSKNSAGVGIGLDVTVLTKTTEALIAAADEAGSATSVNAGGNLSIDADSSEDIFQLTANLGAGESTSGAGGANVLVNVTKTRAVLGRNPAATLPEAGNVSIDANGSVLVAADSSSKIESYAGTLGLSLSASSVGISVGVLVDIDETSATIGEAASVTARGHGSALLVRDGNFDEDGNQGSESVRGLAVSATSFEDIDLLAIAASGSLGQNNSGETNSENDGGTKVGIAASVGVAVVHGETKATLGVGTRINPDNTGANAGQGILLRGADETRVSQIIGGLAITSGADAGVTGSVSVNQIDNLVWARALGSNGLNARDGGVRLSATGETNLNTVTIAVAGAANAGNSDNNNSSNIVFAGAGSVTVNVVETELLAQIGGASSVNTSGALELTATDNSDISADSGGVAIAISNNDGTTAGAVGASVAVNDLTQTIKASVTDTPIVAGDVSLSATNSAEIDTLTIAGSAAVSNGSNALGGAGSGSGNFIQSLTEANIANPSGTQILTASGDIAILAMDASKINADAGSGALSISTKGGDLGAIAIGAAAAQNESVKTTMAALNDVTASGADVSVSASSTATIAAFTLGIAAALTNSGKLALAGAGSGSGNFITSDLSATIDASNVDASGNLVVAAEDANSITATAGAATASINVDSGTNVGVGLGIAVAVNEIDSSALAEIDDTTVDADGTVAITASSTGSIKALAFGASLTIASSSDGNAAGLSANVAVTTNTIENTTRAAIEDSEPLSANTLTAGGAVTLSATESGVILADALSVSANFAFGSSSGNSISGSMTASAAVNTIQANSEAIIDHVDVSAAGDVSLTASSSKDIDALVVAAGASVSVGSGSGNSVSLTGAGAGATNTTNNSVLAIVRAADVTTTKGGSVLLDATDATSIHADVVAATLSAAISSSGNSGSLAVAVTVAENNISNITRAVIEAGSVITASGALHTHASSTGSISALGAAAALSIGSGQGSLSLSGAGTGAGATNNISNRIEAGAIEDSSVDASGAASIAALDSASVQANVVTASVNVSVGGDIAISLAAAVSVATNSIDNQVQAHLLDSALDSGDGLDIQAMSDKNIEALGTSLAVSVSAGGRNLRPVRCSGRCSGQQHSWRQRSGPDRRRGCVGITVRLGGRSAHHAGR
jgi:hypothetical protein